MLIRGKPVPKELEPLSLSVYQNFLAEVFPFNDLGTLQAKFRNYVQDWLEIDLQGRLELLDSFHSLLFADFFPKTPTSMTFNRKRFSATFHGKEWAIKFSQNYFTKRPFDYIFKTWIHESYHAFLNFLSMRLDPSQAAGVMFPPGQVLSIARAHPLTVSDDAARKLAEKNLLGAMDRYLTYTDRHWAGWDSYYLNVEIIVDDLGQLSFQKLVPELVYRRSYRTASEYINMRLSGYPPVKAASYSQV